MIKDKKTYRILIIEDNPGDFLLVEDFLMEQIAFPVITRVQNFKQAADILIADNADFDVILLDLSLPDKSGDDLIRAMLEVAPLQPIIILTGYSDIEFSIKSISIGIIDYIIKDDLNAAMLYKSIVYAIERKKNITALKESEKRYSDIFHLSPQPMCLYNPETGKFIDVNKAGIEHYGYTEKEFLSMKIYDLIPHEDVDNLKEAIIRQNRRINETYSIKFRNKKKSGEIIDVESFSSPLIINGKIVTLVIVIDVTEKNLYEHRITKAIIKTQEDERYELGGELHDNVCQILAISIISLNMIRKNLPETAVVHYNQCKSYIDLASLEIRNLSHRLAPAFFDDSTLEEAFKILLKSFNVDDKYTITLNFDKSLGKQVINQDLQLNLYRISQEQLKNIFKYAKATSIEVELLISNNNLKMRIADNGIGFDIYSVKKGIGIANMKRRAELFSGRFDINSTVGNGCVVTIEIPLEQE